MNLQINQSPVNFNGYLKGPKDRSETKVDVFMDRAVWAPIGGFIKYQMPEGKGQVLEASIDKDNASFTFEMPKDTFNLGLGDCYNRKFNDKSPKEGDRKCVLTSSPDEVKFTYHYPEGGSFEWRMPKADAEEVFKNANQYGAGPGASEQQIKAVEKIKANLMKQAQVPYENILSSFNCFKDGIREAVENFINPPEVEIYTPDPMLAAQVEALELKLADLKHQPITSNGSILKDWMGKGGVDSQLITVKDTLYADNAQTTQINKLKWKVFISEVNAALMNKDYTGKDTVVSFDAKKAGDEDISLTFRFIDKDDKFATDRGTMKDYKGDTVNRKSYISSIDLGKIEQPEIEVKLSDPDNVDKIKEWLKQSL